MEGYKLRMIEEYKQLKERWDKLNAILDKYNNGTLEFTLNCPVDLLMEQALVMSRYLLILQQRAKIEGIELPN